MIENFTEMMTRDATEQHRQEQMLEVYSVKETLAERGCPIDLKVINKALLIPEEPIRYPGTFLYPHPGANLMKNPFAKKAKAKKKKGKITTAHWCFQVCSTYSIYWQISEEFYYFQLPCFFRIRFFDCAI